MLPVVKVDTFYSMKAELESDKSYLAKGLDLLRKEQPAIYGDLWRSAMSMEADGIDDPESIATLEGGIRGAVLTFMALRSQAEADEMNKAWGV